MADESEIQLPKIVPPPIPFISRDLVSTGNPVAGTEFGGVEGLIQPMPHRPTSAERLSMVYAIEPTDLGTGLGSVTPPDLEGDFQ